MQQLIYFSSEFNNYTIDYLSCQHQIALFWSSTWNNIIPNMMFVNTNNSTRKWNIAVWSIDQVVVFGAIQMFLLCVYYQLQQTSRVQSQKLLCADEIEMSKRLQKKRLFSSGISFRITTNIINIIKNIIKLRNL